MELSRPLSVDRLPASLQVDATPAECESLAVRLKIPAVLSLRCRFTLKRFGATVAAQGKLDARVVQSCVVSLEPVEQSVHETFDVRFVPAGREDPEADDPEAPDEVPYDGARIDLGDAAAEQLALALDPYPRHPDATLGPEGTDDTAGAFAKLAALRRPQ